jgi:O-antigen ligase
VFSLLLLKLIFAFNPRPSASSIRDHPRPQIRGNSTFIRGNSCIEKPLFFILALSFLSIFYSVYKYASIISFLRLISYIALFYLVLSSVTTNKRFHYILWIIFISSSFYALYGILQYRGLIEKNYWAELTSLSSRFINSNHFVDYLAIVLFPMLAFLISKQLISAKLLILPLLGINSIAIIYTKSRFGWLSIFLVFILFMILLFKYTRFSKRKIIFFIFILVTGYWLLVTGFGGGEVILKRLYVIQATGYQSLIQRLHIWWGTLRAIGRYPWGSGLGTFEYIYPQFRIHSDRFKVDYAHNGYLQIALELGLAGLVLVIGLISRYLKSIFLDLKSEDSVYKNTALKLGLLGSIFVMLIHSLVDFSLHVPANSIIFAIMAGMLLSRVDRSKNYNIKFNTRIILVFICLLYILFSYSIYVSELCYQRGEIAYKGYKWDKAISEYKKAALFSPLNAVYYERLGELYARRGKVKTGKNEWDALAITNFRKSLKLNLRNSEVHLSLARVYKKLNMKQLALQEFRKAVKFYPTDGAYRLFLADYLLENNLIDEAIGEYRKYFSLFTVDEYKRHPVQIFSAVFKKTQDYEKLKKLIPLDNSALQQEFDQFFTKARR